MIKKIASRIWVIVLVLGILVQHAAMAAAQQTVAFDSLPNKTYGAAPFVISASASSGLAVTFTSTTTTVCVVSGTTVIILGIGTCTINANQAGNAIFSAAPLVAQSFTVVK